MKNTSLSISKILYVSDAPDEDISTRLPNVVESWDRAGVTEIVSLQVSSSDNWRKSLAAKRIKSGIHVVDTIHASRVFSVAREESVSMVVLDTVTRGIRRRKLVHTLTNGTEVPLLVGTRTNNDLSSGDRPGIFETVVVALDFSPAFDKALRFILAFKELIKALEIVNVVNKKLTIRDLQGLKRELRVTRRVCTEYHIDAESHVYAGKTAEELLASAVDYEATLLVLGISGKLTWMKRLFRQSGIYAVAQQTRVPVLFVP